MRAFILVISLFIFYKTYSQNEEGQFNPREIDINSYSFNFLGDSIISNGHVGNIYLCDTSLIKKIDPDFLPFSKTGQLTYEQCTFKSYDTELFYIHLDYNGAISSIYVKSQDFKIANSIQVGMRLSELVSIYPKLEIWGWHAGAYEHISLPDHPNIILGIRSDNGQKLGFYRKQSITKKFRLDGEVAGIELLSNCGSTDNIRYE